MSLSWRRHAACRGLDSAVFYPPVEETAHAAAVVEEARAVCGRCEVRHPCLEFALANGEAEGVWGGATARERRRILRRRRKSA